jgi:hypothetical protein
MMQRTSMAGEFHPPVILVLQMPMIGPSLSGSRSVRLAPEAYRERRALINVCDAVFLAASHKPGVAAEPRLLQDFKL